VTDTIERKPLVIARGGASAEAPEHTIVAFETAIDERADALGLQVRLTRDAHLVVFGAATLEGTTNGRGPLSAHTVRELKRLDAGGGKEPRFEGQRIQTLHEVLERFRGRTRFWIELPEETTTESGIEERVVSTIEIYDAVEICQVQAAQLEALERVRALNPEIRLGVSWTGGALDPLLRATPIADAVCAAAQRVGQADVEAIRSAGLGCYVGKADEPALVDRLVGWRVDGIVTGRPGLVRARIDRSERFA
jgi:glycerophosphoryl diester phosphodiesterase